MKVRGHLAFLALVTTTALISCGPPPVVTSSDSPFEIKQRHRREAEEQANIYAYHQMGGAKIVGLECKYHKVLTQSHVSYGPSGPNYRATTPDGEAFGVADVSFRLVPLGKFEKDGPTYKYFRALIIRYGTGYKHLDGDYALGFDRIESRADGEKCFVFAMKWGSHEPGSDVNGVVQAFRYFDKSFTYCVRGNMESTAFGEITITHSRMATLFTGFSRGYDDVHSSKELLTDCKKRW